MSTKIGKFVFGILARAEMGWWKDVLQLHDTYGLPFDLIFLKAQETKVIPDNWNAQDLETLLVGLRKF